MKFSLYSQITPIAPISFYQCWYRDIAIAANLWGKKKILHFFFAPVTASRLSEIRSWCGTVRMREIKLVLLNSQNENRFDHLVCIFVFQHYLGDLLNPICSYDGRSSRIRNRRGHSMRPECSLFHPSPSPLVLSTSRSPIIRNRERWLLGGRKANS